MLPERSSQNKKKHKSQVIFVDKNEFRLPKKKRVSCMGAQEYEQMEEIPYQNIKQIVNKIIESVLVQTQQTHQLKQQCVHQIENTLDLLQKFDIFADSPNSEEQPIVHLQKQPSNQFTHKVIKKISRQQLNSKRLSDKNSTERRLTDKKQNKFVGRDKIVKLTSIYGGGSTSSKSIKSHKSITSSSKLHINNGQPSKSYHLSGRIQEQTQTSQQRERRQKQQIIKKLLREHNSKLKEIKYCCPSPILEEYRSSFNQPQRRQSKDLRSSYLALRALREAQQRQNLTKLKKKSSKLMNKENDQTTLKLPSLYNTANNTNAKSEHTKLGLFTQDENGQLIKVKNNHNRQYSSTMHEDITSLKPKQTIFKDIKNAFKEKFESLRNDKLKQLNLIKNQSLISTQCSNPLEQNILEETIQSKIKNKVGVSFKKSYHAHRGHKSMAINQEILNSSTVN